jgi:dihydroorotase
MSKLCIKSGRVIDPANKIDSVMDVLIERGKVVLVEKDIDCKGAQSIDASGMIVTPGLIDMHIHLREPGREDEETITSGTKASARGGFTSIACMPNTNPVADTASVIEMILEKSAEGGVINVFPIAAITKGQEGQELTEMGDLVKTGVVGFSDDGKSVMNARVMRRAFEYNKMFDKPLILHEEDTNLSASGQMNEGYYSTILGLKGIPAAAEEVMVARDLNLAELTEGRLHITHVSTKGSVDLIRAAKKGGIQVTCDTTPHHLILTDQALLNYDTNCKVNPPLRTKEDIKALKAGLMDGTIDAIASDHAPHAQHEKEREFIYAPFGLIGLETTLPLILTELIGTKGLTLSQVIFKLTCSPAQILGISKGNLSPGADADILIFDYQAKVKVDINEFESKSRNCPFDGWALRGAVKHVLVGGKVVVKDAKVV